MDNSPGFLKSLFLTGQTLLCVHKSTKRWMDHSTSTVVPEQLSTSWSGASLSGPTPIKGCSKLRDNV